MSVKFWAPSPWNRITELAQRHRAVVAVPFIGVGGAGMLPLRPGSVLVTRLDEATVRQGQVDPREVLRLQRAGVEVHSCSDLHAKVYVFGRRAVIGSANVSKSSASLTEACIETTDTEVVAQARDFVYGLRAVAIGPEQIKGLVPLFPTDRAGRGTSKPAPGPRVFVFPIHDEEWSAAVKSVDAEARIEARAKLRAAGTHKVEAIRVDGKEASRLAPGDLVISRWTVGRGFAFEPPSVFLHRAPTPDGEIIYLESPKRSRRRTSAEVRAALGSAAEGVCYASSTVRQVRSRVAVQALLALWLSPRRT